MTLVNEYISIIGCFQGLLLSGLLIADRRMTNASRILGCICFLIALIFLIPFILINIENRAISWAIGLVFFLPVAISPLGYLYCRSAILKAPLGRRDLLHVIPLLLSYALTADISLANPQEMAKWILGAQPHSIRLQVTEYLPVAIAYAYLAWTAWILWQYRRKANDNLSNFDPAVFNWLLSLQIFSLVVWSLKTLPGPTSAPTLLPSVANLFLVILIYVIAIIQWRNPQFFTIPDLTNEQIAATFNELDEGASAREGELNPSIRAELFDTVKSRLEHDKLYLDNGLTLGRLAALTGLNKHHLSEVLNRHAGKNFYEFINGYRIDFVCKRLEQACDRSVLDIAMEAGFSSKSTFNAIFKKCTGRTPTQYRMEKSGQTA